MHRTRSNACLIQIETAMPQGASSWLQEYRRIGQPGLPFLVAAANATGRNAPYCRERWRRLLL